MVTKDSNILEAARKYPVIGMVFRKYGLGCIGCMVASGESLGEGLAAHGLNPDAIIAEINMLIEEQEKSSKISFKFKIKINGLLKERSIFLLKIIEF